MKPGSLSRSRIRSFPDLVVWEQECGKDDEFWVVAGNFLGDIETGIEQAMANNISEGVVYRYFVHSHADVLRLRALTAKLSSKPDMGKAQVENAINIVLISNHWARQLGDDHVLNRDYFLRRLKIGKQGAEDSGCIISQSENSMDGPVTGELLDDGQLQPIIEILEAMLPQRMGHKIPDFREKAAPGVILITDLEGSTKFQQEHDPEIWESFMKKYDLAIAQEVSKNKGHVVKFLGDGYMCFFRNEGRAEKTAVAALNCAFALQRHFEVWRTADRERNPAQRIALANGDFTIVERSHGFDLEDKQIALCSRLIEVCMAEHILASEAFWNKLPKALRGASVRHKVAQGTLKGFDEIEHCRELLWTKNNGQTIGPMETLGK